jgi:hypothetical protein
MKVWTVTVMSPQLVYVNSYDLLLQLLLVTVKQVQKRKKIESQKALMIQQVTCGVQLIKKTKLRAFPWNRWSEYSN